LLKRCPVCGKAMTIGVLSRVMDLADRSEAVYPKGSPDVFSLIPLPEILSELTGVGVSSKTVMYHYLNCVECFGSELNVLMHTPLQDLATGYSPLLAEAVSRVRLEQVLRRPGYDGEFGVISLFKGKEKEKYAAQDEVLFQKYRKNKV